MPGSNVETTDHTWVAELWPAELQFRHAIGLPQEEAAVTGREVVPRTLQGLLEWAFVGSNPAATDSTRSLLLQYRSPPLYRTPANVLYPVGIRVQGFVESCNLRALGSWSRDSSPSSALQHIILYGGVHEEVFGQYISAISEVTSYIYRSLNCALPEGGGFSSQRTTLFVARRVFTKITHRNRGRPSVLEPRDDPLLEARAVEHEWRVTEKPRVGAYIVDETNPSIGTFVAVDPMSVGPGDFVDVCVGFDIAYRPGRGGRKSQVQVHLNIEHVVLLVAAARATDMAVDATEVLVETPGLEF
ncbi:hypothetical protein R3P38DRAFT_2809848 [Favolaschia claudopus]|uniref:Uncharacterized protein n=1 Tax=Favolaschia claudopus TaxID=2862362 RepID=A0AAV9ZDH7_9AGAR